MNKKLLKILHGLAMISLFLIPLSLLVTVPNETLNFIIFTKSLVFRVLVSVSFFSWIALAVAEPRYRINTKDPFVIVWGLFLLGLLISNLLGDNFYHSFHSDVIRMDGYLASLHIAVYILALKGILKTQKQWIVFFWMLFLSSWISGIHGITSIEDRVSGLLGNAAFFSTHMLFGTYIGALLLTHRKDFLPQWKQVQTTLIFSGFLIFIWGIFESQTRGAILALLVSIIVGLFYYASTRKSKILLIILSVLLLIGSSTSVIAYQNREILLGKPLVQDIGILERTLNTSNEDLSTKWRIGAWKIAWEGIKERPFLGWGQENFIPVFQKHYLVEIFYDGAPWNDKSHNIYIDWLLFGGIIGLGFFLTLLILLVKRIIQSRKLSSTQKIILLMFTIGYLVKNLVLFDTLESHIYFFMLFAYLMHEHIGTKTYKKHIVHSTQLLSGICLVAIIFTLNYPLYKAQKLLRTSLTHADLFQETQDEKTMYKAYDELEELIHTGTIINDQILRFTLNRYISTYQTLDTPEAQKRLYDISQELFKKEIQKKPNKGSYFLGYSNILAHQNKLPESIDMLKEIEKRMPTNAPIILEIARKSYIIGDQIQAKIYLDKALEIEPRLLTKEEKITILKQIEKR